MFLWVNSKMGLEFKTPAPTSEAWRRAGLPAGWHTPPQETWSAWVSPLLALVGHGGESRGVPLSTPLPPSSWAQAVLHVGLPCFPPLCLCLIRMDKVKFLWWR